MLMSPRNTSVLDIDYEDLREIYKGTKVYDYLDVLYRDPIDHNDFILNFLSSKLWRLNNLYHIVNKQGELVIMKMTRVQHLVYAAYLRHPRLIILKSRQQGISTFWLVAFFDILVFYPNKKVGLMSQGLDESSELLDKLTTLWFNLDSDIKAALGVTKRKDNSKVFELNNGSKMLVRTSFRSGTLQALHISEFGKIANAYPARAREVKTGSLQAIAKGLPAMIESTAEGVNDFKYMWDDATNFIGKRTHKDFYPLFLPWTEDPDCNIDIPQPETKEGHDYFEALGIEYGIECSKQQKWFWESQFRELGLDIYQEYPATPEEAFKAALEGAYYGSYVAKYITRGTDRIRDDLYDPNLPVTVSADLGMNDEFVLCFWQYYAGEHRLIREYVNSDEITEHYVDLINFYYKGKVREIILPHDASVRDNNVDLTRYDVFSRGFPHANVEQLERTSSVIDDIQEVRRFIPSLVIDSSASYIMDCLMNYSKEYDDRKQVWRDQPCHDQFSHGADTVRYYVLGNSSAESWVDTYESKSTNRGDYYEDDEYAFEI